MTARETTIERIMMGRERLYRIFASDRSDPLFELHLTMPQLKTLMVLYLQPTDSAQPTDAAQPGVPAHELAEALGVTLATVTGIVDRLESQELVARRLDPRDRRVRRVELTPAGRQRIDAIMTAGATHHRRLLDRLSTEELLVVERATELLLDAAEADTAARTE